MLYELAVAFAIGFITGMVYEAERISRMVATEKGLRQFLLTHAPWHLRRVQKKGDEVVRKESGIGYMAKVVILALIILMILSVSGLL